MTTTPNPTAAQIVADAITAYWADEERSGPNRGPLAHDFACGEAAAAALRAHGLLSEGAPSDLPDGYSVVHCRACHEPALALTGGTAFCEPCALNRSHGAPSEEQIERAAKALYDTEPIRYALSIHYEKVGEPKPWDALNEATKGVYRRKAIKVLTAAGVAPQEPLPLCGYCGDDLGATECPAHGKNGYAKLPTDREKLIAEIRRQAHSAALRHYDALCNVLWEAAKALAAPLDPEKDERVLAWEQVAAHPALKRCYDEGRPLLPAVLDRLTNLFELEQTVNELAPAPERLPLDPEKVAEWMDSPTHAPMSTHSPADGWCVECPWPIRMLPAEEFIDALCEAYKEGKLT